MLGWRVGMGRLENGGVSRLGVSTAKDEMR